MNYHHLYYFYVIAKEGTISKASARLLLAQSTLSAQLSLLEASLGRRLFTRKSQRLHLTDDGRMVLDYAESIFRMGQELQDTLKDRPVSGRLGIHLGVLSGTPHAYGHALLEFILKEFPGAHIDAKEGSINELVAELREQRLDVILTDVSIRTPEHDIIDNHLVGKIPIVFTASPAVARRYRRIPQDLDGAPFILPSLPRQAYHHVQDLLTQWKIKPLVVAEVQDVELARRLAVSGHGIAPINAYTATGNLPGHALAILGKGKFFGLYESVFLVTQKRKWPNLILERILSKFRLPSGGRSPAAPRLRRPAHPDYNSR
jgi:LysR family transcriptional regulator, transcriptional activator of nhaA